MSFFNLSDNTAIASTGEFEVGGGESIPNNTDLLAAPDDAKWDMIKDSSERYISLRWSVLAPKEFSNRKVFHKLRVNHEDPKKADQAKRMLAAIDANAGGKLLAGGVEPTDQTLAVSLINKPMIIKVMVWEMSKDDGTTSKGNWIAAVSPRNKKAVAEQQSSTPVATQVGGFDDDIPF